MNDVPEAAIELAARPEFDGLHDPDSTTELVEPYHDPVGYPTIGHGHLLSRERWAPLGQFAPISAERALELLRRDMAKAARSVCRLIQVDLTEGQYAALIDFTFNCGSGNLQASTLRRVINRGEFGEAPRQFRRWVYAGGVKLPGLVRRRGAEVDLFVS